MKVKKMVVLTSGGDAPGMNATVSYLMNYADSVGIRLYTTESWEGFARGEFYELLKKPSIRKPGSQLGCCRGHNLFDDEKRYGHPKEYMEEFLRQGFDMLVAIGGNGTRKQVYRFKKMGLPCVMIPASIDGDLFPETYSLGTDSAIQFGIRASKKLEIIATSMRTLTLVVETMGNESSLVAQEIASGTRFPLLTQPCNVMNCANERIILIPEGVKIGEQKLSEYLVVQMKNQGLYARLNVLGYLQRAATPTKVEIEVARKFAEMAIDAAMDECFGQMVALSGLPRSAQSTFGYVRI